MRDSDKTVPQLHRCCSVLMYCRCSAICCGSTAAAPLRARRAAPLACCSRSSQPTSSCSRLLLTLFVCSDGGRHLACWDHMTEAVTAMQLLFASVLLFMSVQLAVCNLASWPYAWVLPSWYTSCRAACRQTGNMAGATQRLRCSKAVQSLARQWWVADTRSNTCVQPACSLFPSADAISVGFVSAEVGANA